MAPGLLRRKTCGIRPGEITSESNSKAEAVRIYQPHLTAPCAPPLRLPGVLEIPHSKWEASYTVPKTLEGVKFATTFKTRLGPIPFSVTLCPTKGQEG